jgi:ankyrin repeat protein
MRHRFSAINSCPVLVSVRMPHPPRHHFSPPAICIPVSTLCRFKRTWTKEKEKELETLSTRKSVSAQVEDVSRVIRSSRDRHGTKMEGDRLFEEANIALDDGRLADANRLVEGVRARYDKSGYTRTEESLRKVTQAQLALAVTKIQSYWRGNLGRKKADALRWSKDRFRLEASSLFLALDADHGGTLSRDELNDGLALVGYSGEEINLVLSFLDADGDGEITLDEFIAGFREAFGSDKKQEAKSPASEMGSPGAGSARAGQKSKRGSEDGMLAQVWDDDEEENDDSEKAISSSIFELPQDGGGTVGRKRTGATTHVFADLHYSAKKGDVLRCWALVNRTQVPVNARTSNGTTALHLAAHEGHVAVINVLVALGAELETRSHGGYTPLHCAAGGNHADAIKELVRVRADVSVRESRSGASPLHWAAREGHVEAIDELIKQRAKVDIHDKNQNTPLMYAARHARSEAVELLLKNGASLTATNVDGRSALFHAAEAGHTQTALKLVDEGSDVKQLQDYGLNAADLAESNGFSETATVLREKMKQEAMASNNGNGKIMRTGTERRLQISNMFQKELTRTDDDNQGISRADRERDAIKDGRNQRRRGGILL